MAAVLVLEPIFEADFKECSFGFRPQRSAHQALVAIQAHLASGKLEVYDADLAGYFDSIPHDKLIEAVRRRMVDSSVLRLLEMWLTAPVVEPGPGQRSSWRPTRGTPQGGVISPLLANLYLHQFDAAFHGDTGPAQWANARMVRYADDFVVLVRYVSKRLQDWIASELEGQLRLKIHDGKTQIVDMRQPGASFDFLGYTFRYDDDRHGRAKKYLNMFPSKKSLARERETLRQMTDPRYCFMPIPAIIRRLNRHLKGWSNYFGKGYPRKAFREINNFVRQRLTRHLKRRSQRPYHPPTGKSFYAHFRDLGLEYL
jgi:RNA-directed DNA polymerase